MPPSVASGVKGSPRQFLRHLDACGRADSCFEGWLTPFSDLPTICFTSAFCPASIGTVLSTMCSTAAHCSTSLETVLKMICGLRGLGTSTNLSTKGRVSITSEVCCWGRGTSASDACATEETRCRATYSFASAGCCVFDGHEVRK